MVIKITKLSLLFSVWGVPENYSEVDYRFDDDNKTYHKNSPIFPIIERYNISRENAYIFIPITVSTYTDIIKNSKLKFEDVHEAVKQYTKKYIDIGIQDFLYDNIKVIHGIGKYIIKNLNKSLKIAYHHEIPYYQMFYIITDIILNKIRSKNYDEIKILLDQSNGVNFYTTIIYRILKDISMLLAYKYEVSFQVFNCDPVLRGIHDSTIHTIENIKVDKYPQINYIKNKSLIGDDKLFKRYNAFIYAIRNCIPLLFLSLYHEIDENPIIVKKQDEFLKSFKIEINDESIIIDNKNKIPQDFDILLKLKLIKNIIKVKSRRSKFSLKDIYTHKFSLEYNPILEYRIEREIRRIINDISPTRINFEKPSKWEDLISDVKESMIKNYSKINNKNPSEISLRNFVAHMGLEKNCFELERAKDDILINYRRNVMGHMINEIISHLKI